MRMAGVTIPNNKRLEIGLTAVFGIGRSKSIKILKDAGVDKNKKAKDLNSGEEDKIKVLMEKHKIEGDLRREISFNVKRFKDIKSYRGIRHTKRLPVRGQRTKTNSRTVRGNIRKTMGSGRKKVEKK